jgi:CheY-like chemotaxis protein
MSKILIADDDATMLGLLKTLMELEGNQVITVTRPEQILPAARQEAPALILMDYHLAGGVVIDALVAIKNDVCLGDIPVLVTSGMDHEVECLRVGADGFILKPFRPNELIDRIERMKKV